MPVSRIVRMGIGMVAAIGIAVGSSLAMAGTASAATTYTGKVTANGGVTVRSAPSVHTSNKGTIAKGATIKIDCKVPATSVDGNNLWYALTGKKGWVSARYVANVGAAPKKCPAFDTEFGDGRTTATVNLRSGPHFNDAKQGSLKAGTRIASVCFVKSTASVGGNNTWYLLDTGRWISGAYVKRLSTPGTNWAPCAE